MFFLDIEMLTVKITFDYVCNCCYLATSFECILLRMVFQTTFLGWLIYLNIFVIVVLLVLSFLWPLCTYPDIRILYMPILYSVYDILTKLSCNNIHM